MFFFYHWVDGYRLSDNAGHGDEVEMAKSGLVMAEEGGQEHKMLNKWRTFMYTFLSSHSSPFGLRPPAFNPPPSPDMIRRIITSYLFVYIHLIISSFYSTPCLTAVAADGDILIILFACTWTQRIIIKIFTQAASLS